MSKKVIVGIYTDPDTGIRFIEDDRGNYHLIPSSTTEDREIRVTVVHPDVDDIKRERDRYKRILEKLRAENNWLWSVVNKAVLDGRTGYRRAIERLEKAIKERER
jgi:hypothetical protein